MIEWWGSLGLVEQAFFGVAMVATVLVLIQSVLMVLGSDMGADLDIELDTEHASGLKVLSLQTISAFLVGIGWIGGGVYNLSGSLLLAVLLGCASGAGFGGVIFFLFRWVSQLRSKGNVDPRNAIGQTGKVYIPIPASRQGEGQIEITFQNRYQVLPAVTSSGQALPAQTEVLVVDLEPDNVFVVRPLEQPQLSQSNQPQLPNPNI